MWENSAVEMLLDKINDLTRRIEILETRTNSTYSSCTTSIPINATRSSYWSIWATSTATRAEMTAYWASMADMWNNRMDEIQRQLDSLSNTRYEIRDGNLYITWVNDDWGNN